MRTKTERIRRHDPSVEIQPDQVVPGRLQKVSRLSIAAQTIKDQVSALDVGQVLGLTIRNGRCQCPLHGGKDYNCVLYTGSRGFYCHVCKAGGDVIKLVQESQGLDFKTTVAWFDRTFQMGLELEKKIDPEEQRRAEMALQRRRERHEFVEWKKKRTYDLCLIAERIEDRLKDTRETYRPRTYGEWDERFCEAVKALPEARKFSEECLVNNMIENMKVKE